MKVQGQSLAEYALIIVLVAQPTFQATPTFVPLPMVSAGDVLKRLRQVGVPVLHVQTLSLPNKTWSAKQGVQFCIQQDDKTVTFLVVSYASESASGVDGFKASVDARFKDWHLTQYTNVLVLSSPNTLHTLDQVISSHITQYLIAPYRAFLPTPTVTPAK